MKAAELFSFKSNDMQTVHFSLSWCATDRGHCAYSTEVSFESSDSSSDVRCV